jgi:hypothetical protein
MKLLYILLLLLMIPFGVAYEYQLFNISCEGDANVKFNMPLNGSQVKGCNLNETVWSCPCNTNQTIIILETNKTTVEGNVRLQYYLDDGNNDSVRLENKNFKFTEEIKPVEPKETLNIKYVFGVIGVVLLFIIIISTIAIMSLFVDKPKKKVTINKKRLREKDEDFFKNTLERKGE